MIRKKKQAFKCKTFTKTKTGTVSVLVVSFAGIAAPYLASADPVSCIVDGVFQTCMGNNAGGIVVRTPVETLSVQNVTANIAPTAGVIGIDYNSENNATVLSKTGSFSILTTDADAINVSSDLGDVYISHEGDISADNGRGIVAFAGNGSVVVEGSGTITADLNAVLVDPRGGAASFNWDGDITSLAGAGIVMESDNGGASISGAGNIAAKLDAVVVDARGAGESASFNWDGNITSDTGNGVFVYAANGGVSVDGSGDVSAAGYGFLLDTKRIGGNASLTWTGDISSDNSYGANVLTVGGGSTINGEGTVTAELDGLYANGIGGNAQINWKGDVNSAEGYGIIANSPTGGTTITGSGNITSKLDGLTATNKSSSTSTINWNGDVTSSTGRAVTVKSSLGGANLQGSGTLSGATDGVYIETLAGETAALSWVGNISASNGNGARLYSSQGPSSVTMTGNITASNGGIYAASGGTTGDNVSVSHTGNITSGGVGIEAISPQADVSVNIAGDINAGSYGIYARSTGSSTVEVTLNGDITASGFDGIFAQSSTGIVAINQNGSITSDRDGIFAESKGANTVSVTRSGDITAGSDGIYAFSSQGVVSVSMSSGTIVAVDTGIYARSTGNNTVDVLLVGNVAQSTTAVSASTSNGNVFVDTEGDLTSTADTVIAESDGVGEVGVNHSGDITSTTGDGIYARSATGIVTVYQNDGALVAAQHGLHLKGFNNLIAEVGTGASVTGGASYAGVFMDTGYNNTLTNYGTIDNSAGVDGYAIKSEGNNTIVYNYGVISGNVALGPYANGFTNYEGALLETGSVFKMVSDDTLLNKGTLSAGGIGQLQVTDLTGNLETTSSSVLKFDLDMDVDSDRIDRIDVSGRADLAGKVRLNFLRVINVPQSSTFITTNSSLTNQTFTLTQNEFVDASFQSTNSSQDVQVTIDRLNFAPDGLRGNAQSVGNYFQRAMTASGAGIENFGAIIVNAGYDLSAQAIYEEISPEIALAPLSATYDKSSRFANALMSCSVPSGRNSPIAEGECNWLRMSATSTKRTSHVAPGTNKQSGVDLSFGVQQAIDMSDWRTVYAGSSSSGNSEGDAGQSVQSDTKQLGVALKYAPGPFVVSAGLTGSWSSVSTTRDLTLGDVSQALVGSTDVNAFGLKMRAAYLIDQSAFYLKPQLDINATIVRSGAYSETGGSGAIAFAKQNDTFASISPSIEIGHDFRAQSGQVTRAFARIGSTLYSKHGIGVNGRLETDTTGADMFAIDLGSDKQVMDVSLGLTSFSVENWSAEIGYAGRFSKNLEEHSANLKLRMNF